MDLEIADYERTVEALNNTIAEKDKLLEENRAEIDMLEDRVKTLKEQIGKIELYERTAESVCNKADGKDNLIQEN